MEFLVAPAVFEASTCADLRFFFSPSYRVTCMLLRLELEISSFWLWLRGGIDTRGSSNLQEKFRNMKMLNLSSLCDSIQSRYKGTPRLIRLCALYLRDSSKKFDGKILKESSDKNSFRGSLKSRERRSSLVAGLSPFRDFTVETTIAYNEPGNYFNVAQ